jgi:hypothetical protein
MIAGKSESIAQFLEMNQRTKAVYSFARRTKLLIASGLVKGIIPTSMRNGSDQLTLDHVLNMLDGEIVE